jgi:hypothetical protein
VYPFERFSEDAKKVLTLAQQEAERARHSYIGTEHLLLAVLQADNGAARVLNGLGVREHVARATIERVLSRNERIVVQQIIPTSRVKKVIELSFATARSEDSGVVTPEHLVTGLLEEGEGVAAHVLADMGVTLERFRQARSGVPGEPAEPWPAPGARVLVHDPEPPYRLWEGSVAGHEGGAVLVSVPGHPTTPETRVRAGELHPLPLGSTPGCERCKYTEDR